MLGLTHDHPTNEGRKRRKKRPCPIFRYFVLDIGIELEARHDTLFIDYIFFKTQRDIRGSKGSVQAMFPRHRPAPLVRSELRPRDPVSHRNHGIWGYAFLIGGKIQAMVSN